MMNSNVRLLRNIQKIQKGDKASQLETYIYNMSVVLIVINI